jgi:hypothetical protein
MRMWVHGLTAAFVGGFAGAVDSGIALILIAPETFNLSSGLRKTLLTVSVLGLLTGIKFAAAYLKQSPNPWQGEERRGNGAAPWGTPAKTVIVAGMILIAPAAAVSQVQVSFTPQSAVVAKKIAGGVRSLKGFEIYEVSVCNFNAEARAIHAGAVYQAAQRAKIATVGPAAAAFIFAGVQARHPLAVALDLAQWGTLAASLLLNTEVIQARPGWAAGLQLAGIGFKATGEQIQGKAPDFAPIARALLDGPISLPAQVCEERLLFATVGPGQAVFAEIPSPAPARIP